MPDLDVFGPKSFGPLTGILGGSGRYALYERFQRLPLLNASVAILANPDFEILGTSVADADQDFHPEGGVLLKSHGGATDSAIILPHLDAKQSAWASVTWGTDQQTEWGCTIRIPTALTNRTVWAGLKLTNTPVVATDNDQVFFRYANGTDTNWQCVNSINNVDVSGDSGVAVAAATDYRLWITIDSNRLARFWINGILVYTTAALTDATDLIPYIGILSATDATAKSLIVREQFISRVAA